MDELLKQAYRLSIKKWEYVVADYINGKGACAMCDYILTNGTCKDCPITEIGKDCCNGLYSNYVYNSNEENAKAMLKHIKQCYARDVGQIHIRRLRNQLIINAVWSFLKGKSVLICHHKPEHDEYFDCSNRTKSHNLLPCNKCIIFNDINRENSYGYMLSTNENSSIR